MDYTHKLPPHLGAWPCKILDTAANNGLGQMLALVEFYVTGAEENYAQRIYMLAADLVRIVPTEPTTPYVVGADGHVYRMLPGREPGTDERLWQKAHGGPVFTWAQLTEEWFDAQKTEPVVPLLPVQDVQLPFDITSSDGDRVGVKGDSRNVCLELVDNWTWCAPVEAEQIAWALLAGVRQVRGETRIYPAGTFFKSPAAPKEAKPL